ncbi:MAG TPA: sigma-70 family RNA polymerase sigma factor [Nocardioidaceae bacterium]|nr:sigma-70 family RNA polymerase sigma factor [Nocardioidaceae bacterium]
MTQQLAPDSSAPSDPELIAAVRAGDVDAYGVLFERHRRSALGLARQIAGPSDADDLVSDAFVKLLRVLQGGGGPDVAFRAYLLTAVRRLHIDRIRSQARVTPSDDLEQFDPGTPFADPAVDKFENAAAAKAFASLPERWQLVLWHLEVEGQKPADVAPLLGMTPNGVSALAYRAREGLRQAYLQMHLADTGAEECRWVTERLGAYVRKGLSKRDAAKVEEHLDDCRKCTAVYLELTEVNSNLSAILAPALLGTAAAGYLGSTAVGGASTTLIAGWLLRARHVAKAHTALTVSGTAATVVAASVATTIVVNGLQNTADNRSDVPVAHSTVGLPSGGSGTPTGPNRPNGNNKPPGHHKPPPQNHHKPPGDHKPPGVTNPLTGPTQPTPTTPTTPPSPGPIVVSEIPNPQDDDPPADPNAPGLPPITPPPPTTPPPPPPADPSVTMNVTPLGGGRYIAVIDPATADPATNLMMSIDTSEWTSFDVSGWDCPQPAPGEVHVECFLTSAEPEPLTISITFPRAVRPSITATISAEGYDDPDPSNNTVSWTV